MTERICKNCKHLLTVTNTSNGKWYECYLAHPECASVNLTDTCHVWEEVRNEKVENETVEKEQSCEDLTELKENIQSLLIQNTDDVKGINYTKLKNKTYNAIKQDVIKDPFIYGAITPNDINKEIDRQTMMLIALGLLESINGYIFNPNKIRVGEHIPTVIKKELRLYKQIYKEAPVERRRFR